MQFASVLLQGGLSAQTASKAGDGGGPSAQDKQKLAASAIKLPLFFEANEGQTDPSVRFLTRSNGYTMFLTPTETVLVEGKNGIVSGKKFGKGFAEFRADAKNAKQSVLRMELLGANSAPEFQGLRELPGKVNYLIGKDQTKWHTNVARFSEVQVAKVYPGVDLLFHGDQRQLEYDFVVAPGADPGRIGFKIRGAKRIEIDANGNLVLHTADSEFEMRKPLIYQGEGASRSEVRGRFVLSVKNEVRFALGPYDHSEKLVIDPAINYATFLGGAGDEFSEQLVVDSSTPGAPKIYTTGITTDITSFPEGGSRIGNPTGTQNLYVSEIDPTKTGSASLVYLTFIGGGTPFQSSGATTCGTEAMWLALDQSQGASLVEPVIAGRTECADYPGKFITPNVTGSGAEALAAVVTRLASTGTSIDVSVLLGGNGAMSAPYVFVDTTGNVLVTGGSASTNLPTMAGAYVSTFNNGATGAYDDCYTAKLQRSDLTPTYFSYLNMGAGSTGPGSPAGQQEAACGGVIDSNNPNILYFGGNTFSTVAFAGAPTTALGFQPTFQGTEDAFLMKLDSSVSGLAALQYATYIGGGGITEVNTGAHQLGTGMAVLAGLTTSNSTTNAPDIPLGNSLPGGGANAAAGTTAGENGFVTVMDTTKSGKASLISGSYFGGSSGVDEIRALAYDPLIPGGFYIIVGGLTQSTDFPTLHPFQAALSGTQDGFVAAFFITPTTAVPEFSSYIGAGPEDLITGVDIDSNHAIYATATTIAPNFFGNTSPVTTVNGFQPTCTSCATPKAALTDATIFALTSAASATFSAQIIANTTTLAVGSTEQLNVLATYNDGTFQDLTNKVAWSSSDPTAVTVSSTGLVTALAGGLTATISATFPGTTIASVTITVGSATADTFEMVLVGTAFGTVVDNSTPHQINCTNANGQGGVGSSCDTTYEIGSVVTFAEQASPGSVFAGWSGAVTPTQCPATSTSCTLTVNENPEELIATFNLGTGTPTLMVAPAGSGATGGGTVAGSIGGTSTTIDCVMNGTNTTGTCTQTLTQSGQLNTLTAEANPTSNFAGWTGPCVFITSLNKCVVAMSGTQTVNALFTAQTSSFTVALTGLGTVTSTSNPTIATEIDCGNPEPPSVCGTSFTSGTQVTLTATPATGYSFTNWTAGPCAGATNPCVFTVSSSSPTVATALFSINSYLLTVNRAGTLGGTVTSNVVNGLGGGITCGPSAGIKGCSVIATYNTAVTLTETPPSGGGFGGWSGTPTPCTVAATTCTFNMPAGPETVTATFTTAGAAVIVTPSSLTFGSQAVSSTSAAMSVTVMNSGTAPVNFTGFTTSGPDAEDFGVPLPNSSTGCSPTGTLAAGASCTINVLFTPQANGTRTATLLIADNATGSPQMVALSGTGVTSSVIIAIAPGGSSTATTVSGGTAFYGLTITGAPGVTGTVQLGCVPSSVLITCNVIPGSVTLNGGSTEVAFAIQTFCQGTTTATGFVTPIVGGIGGGIGAGIGLLLVTMVFGGALWTFRRNRRVALTFATLLLVALGSAACNSLPKGPNGATPAGTYNLSLTTTLNGQTQTLNNFLTLVVK